MAEPLEWSNRILDSIRNACAVAVPLVRSMNPAGAAVVAVVLLCLLAWWLFRRRHRLVLSRTRLSVAGYEQVSVNAWMEAAASAFAAWRPVPALMTVVRTGADVDNPFASASVSTPSRSPPWDVDIIFVATGSGTGSERYDVLGKTASSDDWGKTARAKIRVNVARSTAASEIPDEGADVSSRGAA